MFQVPDPEPQMMGATGQLVFIPEPPSKKKSTPAVIAPAPAPPPVSDKPRPGLDLS